MCGIDDNEVGVGGYTRAVIINSAEVVTVVVRAFEVCQAGMDEVGGGDAGGGWELSDDIFQFGTAGAWGVELSPAEGGFAGPEGGAAGHE